MGIINYSLCWIWVICPSYRASFINKSSVQKELNALQREYLQRLSYINSFLFIGGLSCPTVHAESIDRSDTKLKKRRQTKSFRPKTMKPRHIRHLVMLFIQEINKMRTAGTGH